MQRDAERCREMQRDSVRCREIQRDAERFREMQRDAERCRETKDKRGERYRETDRQTYSPFGPLPDLRESAASSAASSGLPPGQNII